MVTIDETARALAGVWRIALFDRAGVSSFGQDNRACARSFWAYLFAAPATLLLIAITVLVDKPADAALMTFSLIIGEVILAVGFPLLMLPLLRAFGRAPRWAWFITGYNWLSMMSVTTQATLICLLPSLPSPEAADVIGYAADIYFLVIEAFLADAVLEIGAWRAAVIVLLDFGFSHMIEQIARLIAGVS
jgi:hypothetical protein